MSDDMWRERRDRDDFSEYGSLFDEAEPTQNIDEVQGKKSAKESRESEAITFGAGDVALCHCPDERQSLEQLEQATKVLTLVALDLLGVE